MLDNFWKDGLSVDESRVSILIILLIIVLLFSGYHYAAHGDISANLTSIIHTLIYAIAGINGLNKVTDYMSSRNESPPPPPSAQKGVIK